MFKNQDITKTKAKTTTTQTGHEKLGPGKEYGAFEGASEEHCVKEQRKLRGDKAKDGESETKSRWVSIFQQYRPRV